MRPCFESVAILLALLVSLLIAMEPSWRLRAVIRSSRGHLSRVLLCLALSVVTQPIQFLSVLLISKMYCPSNKECNKQEIHITTCFLNKFGDPVKSYTSATPLKRTICIPNLFRNTAHEKLYRSNARRVVKVLLSKQRLAHTSFPNVSTKFKLIRSSCSEAAPGRSILLPKTAKGTLASCSSESSSYQLR